MKGIDYSWGRPGGAAIAAAGFAFAMRYVPYLGDGGKGLTAAERDDLLAHGIAIGLVFESTAGRALEGHAAGQTDGATVLAALAALGWPADRPVYFAVDTDVTAAQYQMIATYLDGAASVLGRDRIGIYGEFEIVEFAYRDGCARWYWQTYAWSHDQVSSHAHVWQWRNGQTLNGAAVDYCEAFPADFGQIPKPEDTDMTLAEDLLLAVYGASGEEGLPREERIRNATYRMQNALVAGDEAGEKPLREQVQALNSSHPQLGEIASKLHGLGDAVADLADAIDPAAG